MDIVTLLIIIGFVIGALIVGALLGTLVRTIAPALSILLAFLNDLCDWIPIPFISGLTFITGDVLDALTFFFILVAYRSPWALLSLIEILPMLIPTLTPIELIPWHIIALFVSYLSKRRKVKYFVIKS